MKTTYADNDRLFEKLNSFEKHSPEYMECRNEIVEANMGFLVSYLQRHKSYFSLEYCDWDDLVQECSIKLISAVENYDPSQGKFTSYAKYWMFQAIARCMADNHIIHVPVNVQQDIRRIKRMTDEELAENYNPKRLEAFAEVENMLYLDSLDEMYAEVYDEEDGETYEEPYLYDVPVEDLIVYGERLVSPEQKMHEEAALNEAAEILEKYIKIRLTEKEIACLKKYFYEGKTQEQVGKEMNLTGNRIRQINAKALMKLRFVYAYHKKDYYEFF